MMLGFDKDTWTLVVAGIAAFTGTFNFIWQWQDRRDRIFVGFGPLSPSIDQYNSLYVVNQSKHPVLISDYGLILANGKLFSLPWYWEENQTRDDEPTSYVKGSRSLQLHERLEAGIEYRGYVVGAFALTATQKRPRITFDTFNVPIHKRLLYRSRLWLRREYA